MVLAVRPLPAPPEGDGTGLDHSKSWLKLRLHPKRAVEAGENYLSVLPVQHLSFSRDSMPDTGLGESQSQWRRTLCKAAHSAKCKHTRYDVLLQYIPAIHPEKRAAFPKSRLPTQLMDGDWRDAQVPHSEVPRRLCKFIQPSCMEWAARTSRGGTSIGHIVVLTPNNLNLACILIHLLSHSKRYVLPSQAGRRPR